MRSDLNYGDKIAILSPASVIRPEYVAGAVETLREMGEHPVVMPHTLGSHGSFSGTHGQRSADLRAALSDPEVKAIICSRGGYGCAHLLAELDQLLLSGRDISPKTLVGFSDVSALHALWGKHGWMSIHASMCKQLAIGGPGDPLNQMMLQMLHGELDQVDLPTGWSGSPHGKANREGEGEGMVVGGNLAVLGGLVGTPYNQIKPGTILLIEDVAEPIYKVERILWQLRLAGIFDNLAGLVVGQFTDYRAPSADHADMYAMIQAFLAHPGFPTSFPVAMDVPVGHIEDNRPLMLNRPARLVVGDTCASLHYRQ